MKKIMFSERFGLEQAVLAGKKTQTRRIIPIDLYNQTDWKAVAEGDFEAVVDGEGYYHDIRNCGKYRVGEEVAIAQSYKTCWDYYKAQWESKNDPSDWHTPDAMLGDAVEETKGYRNKMFVKAEYMPHRIRITGIKVERLQDISDEDCLREGVYKHNAAPDALGMDRYKFIAYAYNATPGKNIKRWWFQTPREAFAALIDRISGRGTWQSNPWVYAYTFELIK